jgi:hypothetical protein
LKKIEDNCNCALELVQGKHNKKKHGKVLKNLVVTREKNYSPNETEAFGQKVRGAGLAQ